MSKRLKKINNRVKFGEECHPYLHITVSDFNWLLEQAKKVEHYERETDNLINDHRVPLVVGYWISLIQDGKKHEIPNDK